MASELAKVNDRGVVLSSGKDVYDLAARIVVTELCPKQYKGKPNDAMIAILAGQAVGLPPIQALRGIAVINGRPSMYGEDRTAVCLSRGQVEWTKEWFELDGKEVVPQYNSLKDFPDNLAACWQTKRRDQSEPSAIVRFRVADAKLANLWNKVGPWQQYPGRMLHMRARAWGERDNYADALSGIEQAEEIIDLPKRERDPLEIETAEDADVVLATDTPEYAALVDDWKKGNPGAKVTDFQKWCAKIVGHKVSHKADWTLDEVKKCQAALVEDSKEAPDPSSPKSPDGASFDDEPYVPDGTEE